MLKKIVCLIVFLYTLQTHSSLTTALTQEESAQEQALLLTASILQNITNATMHLKSINPVSTQERFFPFIKSFQAYMRSIETLHKNLLNCFNTADQTDYARGNKQLLNKTTMYEPEKHHNIKIYLQTVNHAYIVVDNITAHLENQLDIFPSQHLQSGAIYQLIVSIVTMDKALLNILSCIENEEHSVHLYKEDREHILVLKNFIESHKAHNWNNKSSSLPKIIF